MSEVKNLMRDEAACMFAGQGDNYLSVPMCTRQAAETCFSRQ